MRNFFRKVAAALRALRASVSEVVLRTVRGIDGTMTWIWDVVTRNAATAPVDYEPDLGPEPAPVQDEEHASLLDIGEQAVAAAQSLVRGQGAPAGTDPILRRWLESLERSDLFRVAEAEPLDVGRHVAGKDVLRSVEGLAIRRPEPEADLDRERLRKRRREEELGDRERALSAAARRERAEVIELEAALRPTPVFTPAGW